MRHRETHDFLEGQWSGPQAAGSAQPPEGPVQPQHKASWCCDPVPLGWDFTICGFFYPQEGGTNQPTPFPIDTKVPLYVFMMHACPGLSPLLQVSRNHLGRRSFVQITSLYMLINARTDLLVHDGGDLDQPLPQS